MIARFVELLQPASPRRRFGLFVVSALAAGSLGFALVSPAVAKQMLIAGGYYFILGVFAGFLFFAWRVLAARRMVWQTALRRPGLPGLVIFGAALFAIWADSFHHKVLFDEYVTQGTAWHMHAVKEVSTPVRAYDFSGTWLAIDAFLDKRPLFFPFLLSLIHDLFGFRMTNVYALNVTLAPVLLTLLYWIARTIAGRGPALFAVVLFATVPLFGQNVTGAGMELLNLVLIAGTLAAAILYLRAPDEDRLSLLMFSAVLLAQCRYESALFVLPVAIVAVTGWMRARRLVLPWAVLVTPLLLVPYAWHHRIVSASPILWQLREGETSRFSLQYLAGNLEGARRFLYSFDVGLPNSWWLSVLGTIGLGWALLELWRRGRSANDGLAALPPQIWAIVSIGAAIGANVALVMFYYWSRFDEPITARFALPLLLLLAIAAAWCVHRVNVRGWPGTRWAAWILTGWFLVWGSRAYAVRSYTDVNLVMQEVEWELEQIQARRGPVLLITSKGTMPFLLEHIPTLNTPAGRTRAPQIAWHMREGTFREVLLVQAIRPTSLKGDLGVDPEDETPEGFQIEPIAQKRFGGRWIRISRVVSIATKSDAAPEAGHGAS